MNDQIEIERCEKCNRYLKPTLVKIEGKQQIKFGCRYCGIVEKKLQPKQKLVPKQCPYCESRDIFVESRWSDDSDVWECKGCSAQFRYKRFIAVFGVEVTLECDPDDVEDLAWELLHDGEPELMGYFEDGKYDANLNFSMSKREVKNG